jgi:hypothetical protein
VILYAVWTPIPTYTVTYNSNGATAGTAPIDPNTYLAGATVTVLPGTGLAMGAFTFTSWNTAANNSCISYAPGATFTMPAANVILYAYMNSGG